MQLTQQIRISPSSEQEEVLWKLSEKCRLIYNFALAERREAWKNKVKGITYTKQQNDLPTLKEQYPEYKWVYSKVLQYVLRTLDANYRSFFALRKNGHRDAQPPAFKGKNYFTSTVYNQSGFKIGKGQISFSHKYDDTPLTFTIPEKFFFEKKQVKQVTIHAKQKKYFVSVTYEEDEKPYVDNGKFRAIDLGVTNIVTAVNSAGKFLVIRNQRSGKYWNSSIAGLQSRRDRCIEYSNRWKHLDGIVRKYQMKCADQTKDFHHKLSRRLVENTKANTIIVGGSQSQKNDTINQSTKIYEKGT